LPSYQRAVVSDGYVWVQQPLECYKGNLEFSQLMVQSLVPLSSLWMV
jgi:hypothetical protein